MSPTLSRDEIKPAYRRRAIILVAVALVAIVVTSLPLFQVHYHQWQMRRARHDTYGKPPDVHLDGLSGYTLRESNERYEYHRQRLVELGAVNELHYRLRHLRRGTPASQQFARQLVRGNRPHCVDFESRYTNQPEPFELTVWCLPSDVDTWNNFIARCDAAKVSPP